MMFCRLGQVAVAEAAVGVHRPAGLHWRRRHHQRDGDGVAQQPHQARLDGHEGGHHHPNPIPRGHTLPQEQLQGGGSGPPGFYIQGDTSG